MEVSLSLWAIFIPHSLRLSIFLQFFTASVGKDSWKLSFKCSIYSTLKGRGFQKVLGAHSVKTIAHMPMHIYFNPATWILRNDLYQAVWHCWSDGSESTLCISRTSWLKTLRPKGLSAQLSAGFETRALQIIIQGLGSSKGQKRWMA